MEQGRQSLEYGVEEIWNICTEVWNRSSYFYFNAMNGFMADMKVPGKFQERTRKFPEKHLETMEILPATL